MVARYGERHSISPEKGGYPPLDLVGEGIYGASHGYYRIGDGNMVERVQSKGGEELGSRYDQDSTAGSCHSLTLSPTYSPQNKSLDCTFCLTTSQRARKAHVGFDRTSEAITFSFPEGRSSRDSVGFLDFALHGKTWCLLSPLINKARQ